MEDNGLKGNIQLGRRGEDKERKSRVNVTFSNAIKYTTRTCFELIFRGINFISVMGLGGKKYLNIISPLSRIRENEILELKVGDETKENIEMNDDDDDLESIQFGRGQKFSKKKKYKYKYMYFSFSLATSIVERDI